MASTGVWRLAVSGVVVLIGLGLGVGTFSVSAASVGPSCVSATLSALIFLGDGVGLTPGVEANWRSFRGVFFAGDEVTEVTLMAASGLAHPRSGN